MAVPVGTLQRSSEWLLRLSRFDCQGLSWIASMAYNQEKPSRPKSKGQPRQLSDLSSTDSEKCFSYLQNLRYLIWTRHDTTWVWDTWRWKHHILKPKPKIKPDPEVVKTIQCNLKPGSQGDSGDAPSWNSPLSSSAENFYRTKWQTLKATSLVMCRLSYLTSFPCPWELSELQNVWHFLICAL